MILISRTELTVCSTVIDIYRSVRGGIRYYQALGLGSQTCRLAYRYGGEPIIRHAFLRGFRVMVRKS